MAAPADEAPRLVYADWLDDRDDPRGEYLRAEVTCAGDLDTLRARAARLDPIWVARVSRPPVGVCCHHLTFRDCGPRLRDGDLLAIDRTFGIAIPADYKAFLLNYNGGTPHLVTEHTLLDPAPVPAIVRRIFPLNAEPTPQACTLNQEWVAYFTIDLPRFLAREPWEASLQEVQWYREYVPIADTVDDIYTILLGVKTPHDDVRLIDWSVQATTFEHSVGYRIASNFSDFLGKLIPATSDYRAILDR